MRLGSGVVPIELHCGDVLMTNFDPVNFCPFDTFLRKTIVQINSKLNSKSYDNSTYTNTVLWQKSFHYRSTIQTKKNTSNCRFRPSRRQQLAGSYLYPIFLCAG